MVIPGKKIARFIEEKISKKIKRKMKLVVFLVGKNEDQLFYVRNKQRTAKRLGINFEFVHIKRIPPFEKFARMLKEKTIEKETTAVVIQQPLPINLQTRTIYNFIPLEKEVEGHKKRTFFHPPIGLAVLTLLKYIYYTKSKINRNLLIKPPVRYVKRKITPKKKVMIGDVILFKEMFRNKKVVLVGRGLTGGKPIGKILTEFKINYINVNSKTTKPEQFFKEADVIITAVGKKIIYPEMLKPGVVLINAGLRNENGKLKGDYDVNEIKNIASFYTKTPGGIGPIDIIYLFKNIIEAGKIQK